MNNCVHQAAPHFWVSRHFQVTCRTHLPNPGSGDWWAGSWRAMSPAEQEGYAEAAGHLPACEACAAITELAATTNTPSHAELRDEVVASLARGLGVTELVARGNDDADHREVHIELLRDALREAYDAGRTSVLQGVGATR